MIYSHFSKVNPTLVPLVGILELLTMHIAGYTTNIYFHHQHCTDMADASRPVFEFNVRVEVCRELLY